MFVYAAFSKAFRKWQSNSKEGEKVLSANEENNRDLIKRSYARQMLNKIQKFDWEVLGISWNKEDDQFKFRSTNAGGVTKRELLWF